MMISVMWEVEEQREQLTPITQNNVVCLEISSGRRRKRESFSFWVLSNLEEL
jgi:hypothetical protein